MENRIRKLLEVFLVAGALAMSALSAPILADELGKDLQAETPSGDKVILHPNGRWEFIDTKKAAEAKEVAKQFPENQGCPPGTQGGYLGLGRCIPIGDKDYNRGSLGGKGR
jgi:hypothetical protein